MQRSALTMLVAALALGGPLACGEPATEPGPRAQRPTDKAALFGDPGLVPTRQGERIRREVAIASEVEQALVVVPSIVRSRAVVEGLDTPDARVLVVAEATTNTDVDALRAQVLAATVGIVGATPRVEVVVEAAPAPESPPPMQWPLWLGLLGLGLCAGVLIERARVLPGAIRSYRSSFRR